MFNLIKSKTIWGFGLALLLFVIRVVLSNVFNYDISETTWGAIIEVFTYLLGLWGIYGFRDAIRKLSFTKYPLTTSKTIWGFAIAIILFAIRSVLHNVFGIDISDTIINSVVNVIEIIASFVGVVGIRQALEKLKDETKTIL